jgi:hypothetical protein
VLLSEPQRSVTLLIMVIGHGLITHTVCFLLNNLYSFKQLLCKQDGCFMSGSVVIFTVGLYVNLSLLSDLIRAIELCRVKNKYISLGVKAELTALPTSYAGCLEVLVGTTSWSHKSLSRPVTFTFTCTFTFTFILPLPLPLPVPLPLPLPLPLIQ